MNRKVKFKDMSVGDLFFAWGDQISNYDFPKECYFKKVDKQTATEILSLQTFENGVSVLVSGNDEFVLA